MARTRENPESALSRHLARLAALCGPLREHGLGHLIGGRSVAGASGERFANHSPVDGSLICDVARGNEADVNHAAEAALAAFADWRGWQPSRRRDLLHAIADGIERRADDIAVLESWNAGQPIRYMSKAALRGAENFRFYADRIESARDGRALPTDTHLNYTGRVPIGPVAVITPWNTPFMLSTWKIAPALAAGCTVVHKPAEWSPVTA